MISRDEFYNHAFEYIFSVPNKEDSFCDIGVDYLCNKTKELTEVWTKYPRGYSLRLLQAFLVSRHSRVDSASWHESLRSLKWAWTISDHVQHRVCQLVSWRSPRPCPAHTGSLVVCHGRKEWHPDWGVVLGPQPTTSPEHDQPLKLLSAELERVHPSSRRCWYPEP